jgi:hypothetical protein
MTESKPVWKPCATFACFVTFCAQGLLVNKKNPRLEPARGALAFSTAGSAGFSLPAKRRCTLPCRVLWLNALQRLEQDG